MSNKNNISFLNKKITSFIMKKLNLQEDIIYIIIILLLIEEENGIFQISSNTLLNYKDTFNKNLQQSYDNLKNKWDSSLKKLISTYPYIFKETSHQCLFIIDDQYQVMFKKNYDKQTKFMKLLENRLNLKPLSVLLTPTTTELNTTLNKDRQNIIKKILKYQTLFITGGAGTGKTTIITHVINTFLHLKKENIILCSPSAKAKNRIIESISNSNIIKNKDILNLINNTHTLHSFLKIDSNPFKYKINRTINADIFIVDETSMVNIHIMYEIFKNINPKTKLIFIGDPLQLPPIGERNIFKEIIDVLKKKDSTYLNNYIHLTTQYRQMNSLHEISLSLSKKNYQQFIHLLEKNNVLFPYDELHNSIISVIKKYKLRTLQKQLQFTSIQDFKDKQNIVKSIIETFNQFTFLTRQNSNIFGTFYINNIFKKYLNPHYIYASMPIIITKNNKELDLFNGDKGITIEIHNQFYFYFQDHHSSKYYPIEIINNYKISYSISIHKAQGSQYNEAHIIIPQKELITPSIMYTAVTRAKENIYLYGDKNECLEGLMNNEIHK